MIKLISILIVVENNNVPELKCKLIDLNNNLLRAVFDYEIVIVDNTDDEKAFALTRELTLTDIPNVQYFKLIHPISLYSAIVAGLENCLGDVVFVFDLFGFNNPSLAKVIEFSDNFDVTYVKPSSYSATANPYRIIRWLYIIFYKFLYGINISDELPKFRILNRKAVTFVLNSKYPEFSYRSHHMLRALSSTYVESSCIGSRCRHPERNILDEYEDAIGFLITNGKKPLRLVVYLSLVTAIFSVIYTVYVILSAIFKNEIAPGWTSISLLLSIMFFIFSLMMIFISEYIMHHFNNYNDISKSNLIVDEFTSSQITRNSRYNVTES